MNSYQLISEIYKLLGAVDKRSVDEARRVAGSSPVAVVLDAMMLALDAELKPGVAEATSPTANGSGAPEKLPQARSNAKRGMSFEQLVAHFETMTPSDIAKALKPAGVTVAISRGDSRERVAKRAVRALLALPDSERKQALAVLSDSLSTQTAGWLNVIRNS